MHKRSDIVGFSGSVNLPDEGAHFVTHWAKQIIPHFSRVYVGCALGVDALVIDAMLRAGRAKDLEIFAAFGPLSPSWAAPFYNAPGSARAISNLSGVAAALRAGATVHWWAGGTQEVPIRGRLAQRSLSLVDALWTDYGALFIMPASLPATAFGPGPFPACGSGTWSTAAAAAKKNVPVWCEPVVPLVDLPCLPSRVAGAWQLAEPVPSLKTHKWTLQEGLALTA